MFSNHFGLQTKDISHRQEERQKDKHTFASTSLLFVEVLLIVYLVLYYFQVVMFGITISV